MALHTAAVVRRRLPYALLAATAALAAGCGGGHQPRAIRSPYRWLVHTAGRQPTVATENRAVGTRAWRLPGPTADVGGLSHGDVSGYVARQAIGAGQTQRIYVDAPGARSVRIPATRYALPSGQWAFIRP